MTDVEQSSASGLAYLKLGLLALAMFLVGTNAFVIAGLLPDIGHGLNVSETAVSFTITIYAVVVAIIAPLLSILLPTVSRRTLLTAGMAIFSAGTLVAALAPNYSVLTAGRLVAAVGAAGLVPAATAAASVLLPPHQRGRALAIVAGGFSIASALGSPIGTAIGALGGWRVPFLAIAGLGVLVTVGLGLVIGHLPIPPVMSLVRRFALLKDDRVVLVLVATLAALAGFNIVYIFSSEVTQAATGGLGSLLATLLLAYGIAGVVGNTIAGPLTDRLGSRLTVTIALGGEVVSLAILPFVEASFAGTMVIFAIWGLTASAALIPIQHRLVSIDPATAGLAMSWYATAMYLGIAIAPPLGALAFANGGAFALPLVGATVSLIAGVAYLVGHRGRARFRATPDLSAS